MKLHSLTSVKKRVQRVGRGGKRGTTAGRGTKGQHSRAGRRLRPAERDLILRIPKQRGFRNKTKRDKAAIFNAGMFSEKIKPIAGGKPGFVLTVGSLKAAGMLPKSFGGEVKILGIGEISFPISTRGIAVSASAKEKIEKAGGKVSL
jgi:large subunit ribosomal protein L15